MGSSWTRPLSSVPTAPTRGAACSASARPFRCPSLKRNAKRPDGASGCLPIATNSSSCVAALELELPPAPAASARHTEALRRNLSKSRRRLGRATILRSPRREARSRRNRNWTWRGAAAAAAAAAASFRRVDATTSDVVPPHDAPVKGARQ